MGIATDHVVNQLDPITANDAGLRSLAGAVFVGLDALAEISHGETHDGLGILLDVDEAPAWALLWLGQFAGVGGLDYLTEAAKRAATKEQEGIHRGTLAAAVSKVKDTLTGDKFVFVQERYQGNAYRVLLVTHTAETTDAAVTKAAFKGALPAGRVVTHTVTDGQTYAEAEAANATYTDAEAAYATYTDAENG